MYLTITLKSFLSEKNKDSPNNIISQFIISFHYKKHKTNNHTSVNAKYPQKGVVSPSPMKKPRPVRGTNAWVM